MKDDRTHRQPKAMETLQKRQLRALEAYESLLQLKNYSKNTIKNYRSHFIPFLFHFRTQKPSGITKNEILTYLLERRTSERWSASLQNQIVNSLKFFFEHVCNRQPEMNDLPRAKKPEQLQAVFDEKEVKRLIEATSNLKHRSMLCLAYATGLRVSEIVRMRLQDIDTEQMVITIRQATGRKDRQVILSEKLLQLLREYYKEDKPKDWLLKGQNSDQYSTRSDQKVLTQAKARDGIKKQGAVHALRYSFATHLLKGGTYFLSIAKLHGINRFKTSVRLTHLSKSIFHKCQNQTYSIIFY